jgi:hypothetical protein
VNKEDFEILVESMRSDRNPNPNPPSHAVRLLEETCTRTGLDWKQRHVYLIQRGGKWSVTLSIDGFRLVANQDAEYAGQEGPFWTLGPDQPWTDIPPTKTPYAAKVGVVRNKGGVVATTWGVAKYDEYKAGGPMWTKFATTMVAKCAEMLALRKALPGKLGGLYGVEEMDQAAEPRKSARNTIPADKPTPPREDDTQTESWEGLIAGCSTVEELKALGLVIQKTSMGLEEKMELNSKYTARKKELVG